MIILCGWVCCYIYCYLYITISPSSVELSMPESPHIIHHDTMTVCRPSRRLWSHRRHLNVRTSSVVPSLSWELEHDTEDHSQRTMLTSVSHTISHMVRWDLYKGFSYAMRSLEQIVALLPWCLSICPSVCLSIYLSVWDGRALWSYGTLYRRFTFTFG